MEGRPKNFLNSCSRLMSKLGVDLGKSPEERLKYQQAQYYESILAYVADATDVFIFGPGQAKLALKQWMDYRAAFIEKTIQVSQR